MVEVPNNAKLVAWVMVDVLDELGVDMQSVLRWVGLSPDVREAEGPVPLTTLHRIMDEAVQLSGDPMLPCKVGLHMRAEMFGCVGYCAKVSATLGDVVTRLLRYDRVVGYPFRFAVHMDHDKCRFEFHAPMDIETNANVNECALSALGSMARTITGTELAATEIHLTQRRPAHAEALERLFGAQLVFNSPANAFVFDAAALKLGLPNHDEALCGILERQAERLLMDVPSGKSFLDQVTAAIRTGMNDSSVSARDVAYRLAVSERTLRRRLSEAGTNYQRLLDRVRYQQAQRYLSATHMDISEIAYALGFSDVGGFSRAFKRWSSLTPKSYRHSAGGINAIAS